MICTLQPILDLSRNKDIFLSKTHAAFAPYTSGSRVSEEVDFGKDDCHINAPQFSANGRLVAFRETVRQRQERLEFLRRQDAARRRMSREKELYKPMSNMAQAVSPSNLNAVRFLHLFFTYSRSFPPQAASEDITEASPQYDSTSNYLDGFDYNNMVTYSQDDSSSDSDSDSELDFDSLDWPDQEHDIPVKVQGSMMPFLQSEISLSPKETFVQSPKRELYTLSEDVSGEENEEDEEDDCVDTKRTIALTQIYSQTHKIEKEGRRRWSWPLIDSHDRRRISRPPNLESIPENRELRFRF